MCRATRRGSQKEADGEARPFVVCFIRFARHQLREAVLRCIIDGGYLQDTIREIDVVHRAGVMPVQRHRTRRLFPCYGQQVHDARIQGIA